MTRLYVDYYFIKYIQVYIYLHTYIYLYELKHMRNLRAALHCVINYWTGIDILKQ